MRKALSILLTMIMLVGMLAVGTISASAAVKTTDPAFADNYVLLEYIQNTNGQYIKTGYNAGAKVTVSMDLEITNWNGSWGAIFGSRTDTYSTNSFIACQNYPDNYLRAEIGKGTYPFQSVQLNKRSTLTVSGTEKFTGTGLEMYLFKVNGKWLPSAIYKLYSCKITDNGKVVRDFVPAKRNADGVAGLYDLQNGVFYESASGKAFESMTQKHDHAFNRDGFCTVCREIFNVRDYAITFMGDNWRGVNISFPGAEKIIVKAGTVIIQGITPGTVYIYDKNGNVVDSLFKEGEEFIVKGDQVKFMADTKYGSIYDYYEFADIHPIYADTAKVVEPTCTSEGYTESSYLGKTYTECKLGTRHVFSKSGNCIHCGKKFVASDYDYLPMTYSAYTEKAISFPGAESITLDFHRGDLNMNISGSELQFFDIDGYPYKISSYEKGKGKVTVNGSDVSITGTGGTRTGEGKLFYSITPNYPKSLPVSGNVANINNKNDFLAFRSSISEGTNYSGITVNLNADLDLTRYNLKDFNSASGKAFCGTFNGNGHTIKGVKETGGEYGGLFHVLGTGAVIKNLTLANVNISTSGNAGALASTSTDRVKVSNVNVTSGTVTAKYSVGGLIGWLQKGADISDCSNSASVSGGEHCGGIGGCLQNDDKDYQYTMKNCRNSGAISASKHAGGIAGNIDTDNANHDFSGCTNTGKITSNGDCAGGIVGRSEGGGNFKNCTNSGYVTSKNCAGGIMGWNEDDAIDFSGSENSGTITADKDAGGIIGKFEGSNPFKFASCVNSGNVTGNQTAGGIVGCVHNNGSHDFTNCQNSGVITETGQSNPLAAGGIVGVNRGICNFSGSTNTGIIHGGYSAGGIVGYVDTHKDQNCYKCTNKANVTADVNCAGGITGQAYGGGNYTYCTNEGKIIGKYAGGVLGWNEDDAIDFSHSTNSGTINATKHTSDGCGGGIAGYLGHKNHDATYKAENCVNSGSVTATWCAGGIFGYLYSDAAEDRPHDLSWCRNSGTICANRDCAGGIIGANFGYADFYRCSNSGKITAKTHAGGIFGWDEDDPVYALYASNSGTVSGGSSQGSIYGHLGGQIDTGKTVVGSVLSEGNLWIVIVVAVLVVLGVAALFILKKKKKLVPAGGASTEDDE